MTNFKIKSSEIINVKVCYTITKKWMDSDIIWHGYILNVNTDIGYFLSPKKRAKPRRPAS